MIICNEKEYAIERLKTKTTGENIYYTLPILARYFYAQGVKKKGIENALREYMQGAYTQYQEEKTYWDDYIEKCASRAHKRKLFVSDGVIVTINEWRIIQGLRTVNLRKLAFTLLCVSKLNNEKNEDNNNWLNIDIKTIFNLANIKGANDMRINRLRDLMHAGIISFAKKVDNLNIRVSIVDDDGSQKHQIKEFNNLGDLYMLMTDDSYTRCAKCGKVMKKGKNRKYCDICANYEKKPDKEIECVDCGTRFFVNPMDRRTCRCASCQSTVSKERARMRKRKYDLKKVTFTNF